MTTKPIVEYDMPAAACPYCGKETDMATGVNCRSKPKPGDVSVCIECGEFSVFGADLKTRKPTAEETAQLQSDPAVWKQLQAAQRILREIKEHLQ